MAGCSRAALICASPGAGATFTRSPIRTIAACCSFPRSGSLRAINPYNPCLAMWVAITRQARWYEGTLHPEEALTREQAVRFYTANNAFLLFRDRQVGSLEPGKLADLIVLDTDLLTCA